LDKSSDAKKLDPFVKDIKPKKYWGEFHLLEEARSTANNLSEKVLG
jgi:hypothetical protein